MNRCSIPGFSPYGWFQRRQGAIKLGSKRSGSSPASSLCTWVALSHSLLSEPMTSDIQMGPMTMRSQGGKDSHPAWHRVGTQDTGASFPASSNYPQRLLKACQSFLVTKAAHFSHPALPAHGTSSGWSFVCVNSRGTRQASWERWSKSSLEKDGTWPHGVIKGQFSGVVGRGGSQWVQCRAEKRCSLRGRFGISQGFSSLKGWSEIASKIWWKPYTSFPQICVCVGW